MAVRVTIETRRREAAEVVTQHLTECTRPRHRRGLVVTQVVARSAAETAELVEKIAELLEKRPDLGWIRIRYGDESLVFRPNGRHRRSR